MKPLILTISHHGDRSVGISPEYWEVTAPFYAEDVTGKDMEDFKNDMLKAYQEFCEFRLYAYWNTHE